LLAAALGLATLIPAEPGRAADPFLRRTPTVAVVETAGPAVVSITTENVVQSPSPFRRGPSDPLLDRYFRDFFEPRRAPGTVQNLGSGVIISEQGHVLTNEHVVARATRIFITLADGREFEVEVVGADPTNDLAVLKARTDERLPWIEPGTSSDIMVGEPVIAIGNPFGLSSTVTTGVISALNRSIRTNDHTFHGFIQTDASINPGNSGGPLLNAEGALIGINSAIYNGAEGIGFAIPIDVARRVVAELIEHGEVLPVTLGIDFQDLDPALREVMDLPDGVRGALINRVHPGGPAESAGVRRGDVLARLDDRKVTSARQLFELLETTTPDQELRLQLWRDGNSFDKTVVARAIPDDVAGELASRLLGVSLELQPQGYFSISSVRRGSAAARIGLVEGDLLLGVNGVRLDSEDALRQAMLNLRGRSARTRPSGTSPRQCGSGTDRAPPTSEWPRFRDANALGAAPDDVPMENS
jgi:S1-C subfamily serine protease